MKSKRSITVTLLVSSSFFCAGCSASNDPPSGSSSKRIDSSVRQQDTEALTFDPNNFDGTIKWLKGKLAILKEVQLRHNEIAAQTALADLRKELCATEGVEVKWKVPVRSVDTRLVHVKKSVLCEVWNDKQQSNWPVLFVVTAASDPRPPATMAQEYSGPEFGVIPIGGLINQERAAQLKGGDKVLVNGKVFRFAIDGYSEMLFCNVVLVNSKVLD